MYNIFAGTTPVKERRQDKLSFLTDDLRKPEEPEKLPVDLGLRNAEVVQIDERLKPAPFDGTSNGNTQNDAVVVLKLPSARTRKVKSTVGS